MVMVRLFKRILQVDSHGKESCKESWVNDLDALIAGTLVCRYGCGFKIAVPTQTSDIQF